MTLDEFMQELQGLRKAYGGDIEISLNHINAKGARSTEETPILYKGYMRGNLGSDVNSIMIGHPEEHDQILHWEDWMANRRLERFIAVYNPEDF